MIPRFITQLEQEYSRTFPGNPATIFYPREEQEAAFFSLLRQAIDSGTPLGEEDMIRFFGEDGYRWLVDYYAGWEIEITWPKKKTKEQP